MDELDTTVGSIEREGALRVLSRERAGDVEWVPGDDERLEPDDRGHGRRHADSGWRSWRVASSAASASPSK